MSLESEEKAPLPEAGQDPPGETELASVDPEHWLSEYGDALYRFAMSRVRSSAVAEDLVQETFLAAIRGIHCLNKQSSERAWLMGILRNKVVDYYRKTSRESTFADLDSLCDEQGDLFVDKGLGKDGWNKRLGPQSWPSPEESLGVEEFWQVFHHCLAKLPKNIAQVFLLREMDEISSQEVCKEMNISPNNLWVMLHRARGALRRCLELNWFGRAA